MADVHLQISKSELNGRTITHVKRLNDDERVKEIARMASGEESTVAMNNARQMIASANKFKGIHNAWEEETYGHASTKEK